METNNPAFNNRIIAQERAHGFGDQMTIQGAINKTFVLLGVLLISGGWIWSKMFEATANKGSLEMYVWGGVIGGLIVGLVTTFVRKWAPYTAPMYAICQGFALGGISAIFEATYQGIVIQAVGLTVGTLMCMLLAYKSGLIKATEKFKLGLVSAMGGLMFIFMLNWIMGFFGHRLAFLYSNGPVAIGFSVVVVIIAALSLVLDFDFIEQGAASGMPKYMEWYSAFGLLVTLVWLYIEFLRLLSRLRDRR